MVNPDLERYEQACHAMQSGVRAEMAAGVNGDTTRYEELLSNHFGSPVKLA